MLLLLCFDETNESGRFCSSVNSLSVRNEADSVVPAANVPLDCYEIANVASSSVDTVSRFASR